MSVQRINIFSLKKEIFVLARTQRITARCAKLFPTSGHGVRLHREPAGVADPPGFLHMALCPRNTLLQSVQKSDAACRALSAILRGGCFSSGTRWVILDVRHFDPGTGSVADFH